jgi:preprotein translocase subunit Sss1
MDGEIVTRVVDFIKEKMAEPIRETRKPSWNELISRISEAWDAMHGNEVAA